MKTPPYLDLRRHFLEWVRYVLPIAVVVAAVLMIFWLVGERLGERAIDAGSFTPAPVDLLPVAERDGIDPAFFVPTPLEMVRAPLAARWTTPLGGEHGALAYNAQPFLTTRHLGDDLNGIGGGDSDLGDPVHAAADGLVVYSGWPGDGWGNLLILLHELPDGRMVETFYAHLDRIRVPVGEQVRRGDLIGTVGTAGGNYLAHLHFEIRRAPTLGVGGGYADSALDRLPGERSIQKWRGRADDLLAGPPRAADAGETGPLGVETSKE